MPGDAGKATRQTYAHEALLEMDSGADIHAPGAGVTVELCGHWDHEPPCPVAPHHTDAERLGEQVRLRCLFACPPDQESAVRRRIEKALTRCRLIGPDGLTTEWLVRSSARGAVRPDERGQAERLAAS